MNVKNKMPLARLAVVSMAFCVCIGEGCSGILMRKTNIVAMAPGPHPVVARSSLVLGRSQLDNIKINDIPTFGLDKERERASSPRHIWEIDSDAFAESSAEDFEAASAELPTPTAKEHTTVRRKSPLNKLVAASIAALAITSAAGTSATSLGAIQRAGAVHQNGSTKFGNLDSVLKYRGGHCIGTYMTCARTWFHENEVKPLERDLLRKGRRAKGARFGRMLMSAARLRVGGIVGNMALLGAPKELASRYLRSVINNPERYVMLATMLLTADSVAKLISSTGLIASDGFMRWTGILLMIWNKVMPLLTTLDRRFGCERTRGIARWLLKSASFPTSQELLYAHKHLGLAPVVEWMTRSPRQAKQEARNEDNDANYHYDTVTDEVELDYQDLINASF